MNEKKEYKYYMTYHLSKEEKINYANKGLYCYDMRDSCLYKDGGVIEKNVLINNCGSLIVDKPLILGKKGYIDLDEFLENATFIELEDMLILVNQKEYKDNSNYDLILDYVGNDYYNRPVYRVNNEKEYIKDINLGFGNKANLYINYPSNKLEGEPFSPFLIDDYNAIKIISSKNLTIPDNIRIYETKQIKEERIDEQIEKQIM